MAAEYANLENIVISFEKNKNKCFSSYSLRSGEIDTLDKPNLEFFLGSLETEDGWLHHETINMSTETNFLLSRTLVMQTLSGEILWRIKLPQGINYYSTTNDWVINLNDKYGLIQKFCIKTGELLEEFDIKAHEDLRLSRYRKWFEPKTDPYIYGNVLAFALIDGYLWFFDLEKMQVVNGPIEDIHLRYLALNQDGVLFATQGADLLRIDMKTQSIIDRKTIEFFDGSTLCRDGKILVEALSSTHVWLMVWNDWKQDGRMCAINPETGKEEWGEFLDGMPGPTKIVNNRMYLTMTGMNLANQSGPDSYVIEGAGGYIPD